MSAASEQDQILRKYSVDEIEAMYRNHEIYASDKNYMLREKARITLRDTIGREGTTGAIVKRMMDHAGEGWEKIRDAATQDPEAGVGNQLYHSMIAMWGSVQIMGAATEGLGEVLGMNAEDLALSWGAPPGLARFFNSATYWGTQFFPVGAVAKLGVKAGEKTLAKVSGALAEEAAKSKLTKETIEELHALRAFADGLTVEGVKGADEFVEKVAQAAFKTDTAATLKRVREAMPRAESAVREPLQMPGFTAEAARIAKDISAAGAKEQLPALMKKFGISWPDLKAMKAAGQPAMSVTQFYGHLKALEKYGDELAKLARQATREGATLADHAAFFRYATELFTGSVNRATVTREFQNLLVHWAPAQVGAGDIAGAMRVFAEDMAKLSAKQAGANIFRSQQGFMNVGQLTSSGREHFSNLLLPLSWPAATIGNMYAVGRTVADRFVGRVLEGHPAHAVSEAFFQSKGLMFATGDAIKAGLWEFAHSPSRNAIPGLYGRIVNFQRDTLIAVDSATKLVTWRGQIYADALREAHELGVRNVGAFVRRFVANPPQQFKVKAWEQAQRSTFSNDLGGIASRLVQAAQSGPGYLYFTFMKSPINLYKYAYHNTPGLQMVSLQLAKDIAAGGQRASEAAARLTIASLTGMMFFELAKDGWITGSGMADTKLQASWRLTHEPWSARSSKTGDWFPISRMEPITQPIGFTADVATIMDSLDDATYKQAAIAITLAWVKNFANVTAWRQATDVLDTINGVARGEKFTQHDAMVALAPALTVASGGPLTARTARIMDPVARDQRTLADAWKARVPGKTDEVPPLRDGLGDVIIPPSTKGTRWFGYFQPLAPRVREMIPDRVREEAARLQATLPRFADVIGQGELPSDADITPPKPGDPLPVGLTPHVRDRWQQIYRNLIRGPGTPENPGIEKGLLDLPEYQKAPIALQREMFNNFLSKAKSLAGKALVVEDPELMRSMVRAKFQAAVPKLDDVQRGELASGLVNELSAYDALAPQERENLLKFGILAPDMPVVDPRDDAITIYHPAGVAK